MQNNGFFAGQEELLARVVSMIITSVSFFVYGIASDEALVFKPVELIGILVIFWFSYELLGYLFFLAFKFFSAKDSSDFDNNKPEVTQTEAKEVETLED